MARKIHLRRNKENGSIDRAACATNPYFEGSRRNNRSTYQFMASEIVSWKEFQKINSNDRCAHCMEAALVIRNRQRKVKGLAPVKTVFEGCSEAVI